MMGTFVFNRVAELPACLLDAEGRAWSTGMGQVQDNELPVLRVAALARLPFFCEDDALDAAGSWLKLPRFPGEADGPPPLSSADDTPGGGSSDYRGRLCKAFSTWEIAASPGAIIKILQDWGVTDVEVQEQWDVGIWAGDDWPQRFRVKLGPDLGTKSWLFGSGPTDDEKRQIRGNILQFKSVQSYPVDVVIDYGGGSTESFIIGPILGLEEGDEFFILGQDSLGGFRKI